MDTDLVILGGGPAGLTAGMYAARARIRVALLERGQPGGQIAVTELVDNYPGFEEPILGWKLAEKMESQARKFGVEVVQADVTRVSLAEDRFRLNLDSGDDYTCRALILATGASPVKLGIPGEREFVGKGVSYCAVCDGPFYRDQEIAVVGGGDSAVQEALYLTRFASKVHLIHRRDELRAIKDIQEKAFAEPRIEIHWNRVPVAVLGEKEVKSLILRSVIDKTEEVLSVSGVFFYVGLRPNSEPFRDLVQSDEWGFIITDAQMACSVPGSFAAGDIRSKVLRQISTAVGDGALAAYSAQRYLEG